MTLSLTVKALLVPLVCSVSFVDLEKSPLLRMENCTQATSDPLAQWRDDSLSELMRFGQPKLRLVELMNPSRKALLSSHYARGTERTLNNTGQSAPEIFVPKAFADAATSFFKTSSVAPDKPVIKAAPMIQRQQSNDRKPGLGLLVANQVAVTPTSGTDLVQGVLRRKSRRASPRETTSNGLASHLSLAA